jgi:hypothetical protein
MFEHTYSSQQRKSAWAKPLQKILHFFKAMASTARTASRDLFRAVVSSTNQDRRTIFMA